MKYHHLIADGPARLEVEDCTFWQYFLIASLLVYKLEFGFLISGWLQKVVSIVSKSPNSCKSPVLGNAETRAQLQNE